MFSGSHLQYDPFGGMIPLRPRVKQQPKVASFHGVQQQHVIPIVQPDTKLAPEIVKPVKEKKKRKTSIEGEDIPELVKNIIKEKPNLNLLRKTFKKMVDIVEEQNEQNLIF